MKTVIFSFLFVATVLGQDMPELEWVSSSQSDSNTQNVVWNRSTVVDNDGNVYTTGHFRGTIDFNPQAGVANLTAFGNDTDVFIQKLDADGNFVWVKHIESEDGDVHANSMFVDSENNIYVTGTYKTATNFDPNGTYYLEGFRDAYILKLNNLGDFIWAKALKSTYTHPVVGNSIFVDDEYVYVVGEFENTVDFDPGIDSYILSGGGGRSVFILKLDTSGSFIWAKAIGVDGVGPPVDATSASVDQDGNVYITGTHTGGIIDFDPGSNVYNLPFLGDNGSQLDMYVLKLSSNGDFVWAKSLGGSKLGQSEGIAVDHNQNVYIAGGFAGTFDFDPNSGNYFLTSQSPAGLNPFISKLDSNGDFVWAKSVETPGYGSSCLSIHLDNNNNVYTSGYFIGTADFDPGQGVYEISTVPGTDYDSFLLKLNTHGDFNWAASFKNDYNESFSIAVDDDDFVYASGVFEGIVDFNPGTEQTELSANTQSQYVVKFSQESLSVDNYYHESSINLYPNPAQDQISINNTSNSEITQVKIYNLLGAKVDEITINSQEAMIDVSTLKTGTYFFKIYADSGVVTKKIIKR